MDATTVQPTLLSAAKNFIRKSAGPAVLAIAPLAAVSLAPEAKGQTIFSSPSVFTNGSSGAGFAAMGSDFQSGGRFFYSGGAFNNINTPRVGAAGSFDTILAGASGYGTNASNTLQINLGIGGDDISASAVIPFAFDFTLTRVNIVGNINWLFAVQITDDSYATLANGTLSSSSATFTGGGNYTVTNLVPGDYSKDLMLFLVFDYTTANGDQLLVGMNSASQGIKVNTAAIPETSTYAMIFGLGALGFVMLRRTRRCAA